MLTVLSTVLGFVPFLVGSREGFWYPMAMGTIGGLIMSLAGIYFFLPLFLGMGKKGKRRRSRNEKGESPPARPVTAIGKLPQKIKALFARVARTTPAPYKERLIDTILQPGHRVRISSFPVPPGSPGLFPGDHHDLDIHVFR